MSYIGAHISKDTTIYKTIQNIINNNGNSLQLFVSSPMNSSNPNINTINEESNQIIKYCNDNKFKLVVHGSYVINLANNKINKRIIDIKDRWWIKLLINELEASEILQSVGVIIHIGKYTTSKKEDALDTMYLSIKYIIKYLNEKKYNSKLILETPAGVGTELLKTTEEFSNFYNTWQFNYFIY